MAPTIVLIHGAFADSSSWDQVIEPLESAGHTVIGAANPLRHVASDAEAVSDVVRSIEGPVVLVAHSYGGAVMTNVAADAGDITGLVYCNAFAPDAGESAFELAGKFPGSVTGDIVRPIPRTDGTTDLVIAQELFHENFGPDAS
jgi:pimeloyl-ACP methyl ester carboxylesterase